jgi:hypothetical protein
MQTMFMWPFYFNLSTKLPLEVRDLFCHHFNGRYGFGHDIEQPLTNPILPSLRKAQRRGNPEIPIYSIRWIASQVDALWVLAMAAVSNRSAPQRMRGLRLCLSGTPRVCRRGLGAISAHSSTGIKGARLTLSPTLDIITPTPPTPHRAPWIHRVAHAACRAARLSAFVRSRLRSWHRSVNCPAADSG